MVPSVLWLSPAVARVSLLLSLVPCLCPCLCCYICASFSPSAAQGKTATHGRREEVSAKSPDVSSWSFFFCIKSGILKGGPSVPTRWEHSLTCCLLSTRVGTGCGSRFSIPTVWVWAIEFKSPGLVRNAFPPTGQLILLA